MGNLGATVKIKKSKSFSVRPRNLANVFIWGLWVGHWHLVCLANLPCCLNIFCSFFSLVFLLFSNWLGSYDWPSKNSQLKVWCPPSYLKLFEIRAITGVFSSSLRGCYCMGMFCHKEHEATSILRELERSYMSLNLCCKLLQVPHNTCTNSISKLLKVWPVLLRYWSSGCNHQESLVADYQCRQQKPCAIRF